MRAMTSASQACRVDFVELGGGAEAVGDSRLNHCGSRVIPARQEIAFSTFNDSEYAAVRNQLFDRVYAFLSDRQKRAVEFTAQFAVGSIVGSVRERNEDIGLVVDAKHAGSPRLDYTLAIVCDGMGGMSDGRQAAMIAATTFTSHLIKTSRNDNINSRLLSALATAQEEVFYALSGGGGTTLTAVYIDRSDKSWLVHVGDSRLYAIGAKGTLEQLSRDDTIGAALNRDNEKRANSNRLIQFIGAEGEIEPQIIQFDRLKYQGFLLTSDGAHSAPTNIIQTVVQHAKGPPELVRKILNVADAIGGLDNATAVYVPASELYPAANYIDGKANDGLLVSFLCSSGEHDIWITNVDDDVSPSTPPPIRTLAGNNTAHLENNRPLQRAKGPKRKRTAKPKPRSPQGEELPLNAEKPVAQLDFSDDGETKS